MRAVANNINKNSKRENKRITEKIRVNKSKYSCKLKFLEKGIDFKFR